MKQSIRYYVAWITVGWWLWLGGWLLVHGLLAIEWIGNLFKAKEE